MDGDEQTWHQRLAPGKETPRNRVILLLRVSERVPLRLLLKMALKMINKVICGMNGIVFDVQKRIIELIS